MKFKNTWGCAKVRQWIGYAVLATIFSAVLSAPTRAQDFDGDGDQLPDVDVLGAEQSEKASRKRTVAKTKTRLTKTVGKPAQGEASGGGPGSVPGASNAATAGDNDGATSGPFGVSDVPVPGGGSITGSSTTVISRQQIERAPQASVADIIAREAGVQATSLFGGVNGARTTVDIRGFGATGSSNTLILINGRRLNDWDLTGFNLSTISKESIERIEITRGNSGAVLYGDGAVGGVINIVTRGGADAPNQVRVEGGLGSFNSREGNIALSGSSGPFSATLTGTAIHSDGYRDNNELDQMSAVGDFRWSFTKGSIFFNFAADDQKLGLPGDRNVRLFATTGLFGQPAINQLRDDRRGTDTPFDFADQQGLRGTLGITYKITPNFEVIVDGGIRNKKQQAGFFSQFAENYVDTDLTIRSFTPRVDATNPFFGLPSRIIAGVDLYDTDYESRRSQFEGFTPIHVYKGRQKSYAIYGQQTLSVLPNADISFGGRIQRNETTASDAFNPAAPGSFGQQQGLPLDDKENNYAWHVGAEYEVFSGFTLLGRAAKSFRVANIDERIGAGSAFIFPGSFPTNFNLRTQKSRDWEAGARFSSGPFNIQSTYYDMRLTDELYFNPATFLNANLDPTRRRGVETIASWQVSKKIRLGGNLTYTDAKFRDGPFSGNRVPLVSPWTGSLTLSWILREKWLTLDAAVNFVGKRRMDNDQANFQPYIPSHTTFDLRIGGEIEQFFWSATVNNVFDQEYFDYAVASAFTFGNYNAYPQPGRTFLFKAGSKW